MHLLDFDGNILKSFNPNNVLKRPVGVYILHDVNEEKIFIGDNHYNKIFVFNSNFELEFQFGDQNLKNPKYIQIDIKFDKSRLYVSDHTNNEITIWNTRNRSFIAKIEIDTPKQINFTQNSFYVASFELYDQVKNNKVMKITRGGNCIFEIDKVSFEIKRRVIGSWYSPELLNMESNGNLKIIAYDFINNITISGMRYFLTIDQNGQIIEKVELNGIYAIDDAIFVNNKLIVCFANKLKIFE